jgi:hypothetical protein
MHTRAGVLHDQPTALLAAAQRARPVRHRRDNHQIRRTALTLSQPGSLSLRQLRGNPVRPIRQLDPGISCLREPQRPTVAAARHIRRLARLQTVRLRPPAKAPHRRRDLPQARDRHPLQVVHAALPPLIHPPRLQPPHADQHIDRGHELALRQRRLRRPHDTLLELALGPLPCGQFDRKLSRRRTSCMGCARQRAGSIRAGAPLASSYRTAATNPCRFSILQATARQARNKDDRVRSRAIATRDRSFDASYRGRAAVRAFAGDRLRAHRASTSCRRTCPCPTPI